MKANVKNSESINTVNQVNTENVNVQNENVQVTNNVPVNKVKQPTELSLQKKELTDACKAACKGVREYQKQLNVIINQINEYAKIEGNSARSFFEKCNISIAPKNDKKRDAKRVYLSAEIILNAFNSFGLIADKDTIEVYKLEVPEGTILRKATDKETKVTTLVPDTNLTASKVLNILCRAQKAVLESVAKQKQLQRVAAKNASKKAAKEAAKKAEKAAAANVAA